MIADYFTKPLQGALFWKLRDMIMGNKDIVLPNDQPKHSAVPSIGIPDGLTQQESRSVLKDEIGTVNDCSPDSLTVLSADRPQPRKSAMTNRPVDERVRKGKSLSWAQVVASKRNEVKRSETMFSL